MKHPIPIHMQYSYSEAYCGVHPIRITQIESEVTCKRCKKSIAAGKRAVGWWAPGEAQKG